MGYPVPHTLHVFPCDMGMILHEGRIVLDDFGCRFTQNHQIHGDGLLGALIRHEGLFVQTFHVIENIGTGLLHMEDIV